MAQTSADPRRTVVAIVAADLAFAIDSIPAAFAVTRDPAVIWTANAFALLGLGALLALVDILVRRFRYLDKTIAVILAFVGAKILADDVVHVGDPASLGVIVGLLRGGVAASLVADRLDPPDEDPLRGLDLARTVRARKSRTSPAGVGLVRADAGLAIPTAGPRDRWPSEARPIAFGESHLQPGKTSSRSLWSRHGPRLGYARLEARRKRRQQAGSRRSRRREAPPCCRRTRR